MTAAASRSNFVLSSPVHCSTRCGGHRETENRSRSTINKLAQYEAASIVLPMPTSSAIRRRRFGRRSAINSIDWYALAEARHPAVGTAGAATVDKWSASDADGGVLCFPMCVWREVEADELAHSSCQGDAAWASASDPDNDQGTAIRAPVTAMRSIRVHAHGPGHPAHKLSHCVIPATTTAVQHSLARDRQKGLLISHCANHGLHLSERNPARSSTRWLRHTSGIAMSPTINGAALRRWRFPTR